MSCRRGVRNLRGGTGKSVREADVDNGEVTQHERNKGSRTTRAGAEPVNKHVLIVPTAHVAVLRLVARCRSAWAKLDSPSIIAKSKPAYLSARTTNTAGCCTHTFSATSTAQTYATWAYRSHLSLLFLHGSQLMALRARFCAGGRASPLAPSDVEGPGECGRACLTRGCPGGGET